MILEASLPTLLMTLSKVTYVMPELWKPSHALTFQAQTDIHMILGAYVTQILS